MWRERPLAQPATFIEPCLPRPAKQPPEGRGWIYEIKHGLPHHGPSRRATAVQLLTISKVVGCTTGRSAGFSPLTMRPA